MNMRQDDDHRTLRIEIMAVYDDICEAFAELDFEAVLEHFADEGMVKISLGQVCRGREELAASWRQRIGDVASLQIRMEDVEVRSIDENHAWAIANEYISVDGDERRAIVSNIFVLQEGGWKILLDHTSYV